MKNSRRNPTSKIPKQLATEESAVIQLLRDHFGWRFFEMRRRDERYPYFMNYKTMKGDVARAVTLVVPRTSLIARELDAAAKRLDAKNARAKRAKAAKSKAAKQSKGSRT